MLQLSHRCGSVVTGVWVSCNNIITNGIVGNSGKRRGTIVTVFSEIKYNSVYVVTGI